VLAADARPFATGCDARDVIVSGRARPTDDGADTDVGPRIDRVPHAAGTSSGCGGGGALLDGSIFDTGTGTTAGAAAAGAGFVSASNRLHASSVAFISCKSSADRPLISDTDVMRCAANLNVEEAGAAPVPVEVTWKRQSQSCRL
jgi:hypothetical protein